MQPSRYRIASAADRRLHQIESIRLLARCEPELCHLATSAPRPSRKQGKRAFFFYRVCVVRTGQTDSQTLRMRRAAHGPMASLLLLMNIDLAASRLQSPGDHHAISSTYYLGDEDQSHTEPPHPPFLCAVFRAPCQLGTHRAHCHLGRCKIFFRRAGRLLCTDKWCG
jgi:hypothetical protein